MAKDNETRIVFPQAVKNCLWSYDVDSIDILCSDHRQIIIHNVLDHGTSEAVIWLRKIFSEKEIAETIAKSNISNWSKKSLALWSLVFKAYPAKKERFV